MKAIFLDRDGVINELIYYRNRGLVDSPFTVKQFKLLPNVGKAIRLANKMGLKVIVISNQPGVAKNHFSKAILEKMDEKMERELAKVGAHLDGIYYCLHHPYGKNKKYTKKNCGCRKPKSGLLLMAAKTIRINLKESYMVGDELTDIQAGQKVGCKTILIGKPKCQLCKLMDEVKIKPHFIVKDLYESVKLIKKLENYRM